MHEKDNSNGNEKSATVRVQPVAVAAPAAAVAAAAVADGAAPMTEEERNHWHALWLAQKQEAQALADTCTRMQVRQAQWRDELIEHFRREAEEDVAANGMFRDVMLAEAEAMSSAAFMRWIHEREAFGVGGEGIAKWYHESNGALLAHTPYLAAVPWPRGMGAEGRAAVAAETKGLGLTGRVFYDPHPLHAAHTAGAPYFADREGAAPGAVLRNVAPSLACADAAELVAAVAASPTLAACLDQTGCLFLNDAASKSRERRARVCVAHVFVVRGRCVAIELAVPSAVWKGEAPSGPTLGAAHVAGVAASVASFVARAVVPVLPQRSFVAAVHCGQPSRTGTGNNAAAAPLRHELWNIGCFDARDYALFGWNDLLGCIVAATPRRPAGAAAASAAPAAAAIAVRVRVCDEDNPSISVPALEGEGAHAIVATATCTAADAPAATLHVDCAAGTTTSTTAPPAVSGGAPAGSGAGPSKEAEPAAEKGGVEAGVPSGGGGATTTAVGSGGAHGATWVHMAVAVASAAAAGAATAAFLMRKK